MRNLLVSALKKVHISIIGKVVAFADNVIAPHQELNTMSDFPIDIWQKMGDTTGYLPHLNRKKMQMVK